MSLQFLLSNIESAPLIDAWSMADAMAAHS